MDIPGILKEHGISPSPQRVAIYNFLRCNPVHPTADMIYRALKEEIPTLSLMTVYNTLKLLTKKFLVQEIRIEDGELRYDGDMRDHGHFKCIACSRVYDLFPPEGEKMVTGIPGLPEEFRVKTVQLYCHGVCADESCRAKQL